MKYSSGPQAPTMPKNGPDSVEVRSHAGAARQFSPSAARNCGPIREVLIRVLPKKGIALEIGSGTGEHVICFAKALGLLKKVKESLSATGKVLSQRQFR